MAQTFAQYLINQILPKDIRADKPMTKKEVERILSEVFTKHQDRYADTVSALKKLGDTLSTYESLSFGMDELTPPNQVKRDRTIAKYKALFDREKDPDKKLGYLEKVQQEVSEIDLEGAKDDASLMVTSGAMGGKRFQLMKLRSSPVVLKNHKGELVPEIVTKSYSQGVNVLDYWNGAAEGRANLVQGQVSTSEPGVVNKITHNLMGDMVVSMDDCGTRQGISLFTKDEDVQDRYLAQPAQQFKRNTLITDDVQQELLRKKIEKIAVRSPQTCEAPANSVCSKCMGLSINHRKPMTVGTNAGTIAAGALSEVSTQLVLSAKHSTTMAKRKAGLEGIKGFQTLTEMPKIYPDRQILCEVYGKIYRIRQAPQGGKFVTIRETRAVPERYVVHAAADPELKKHWRYYIPPQRKLLEGIEEGAEVYPGLELTDGNVHLKDVARLRSLGAARSAATEQVRQVYQNTGQHLDRRHFEMLGRAMMNYVRIEKSPPGFPFKRGEVVQYNKLRGMTASLDKRSVSVAQALGGVLAEEVQTFTIGTEITPSILAELKRGGVAKVKLTSQLEVSPAVASLSRTQNMDTTGWVSKLNHRYLKDSIQGAARQGQSQSLHGFSPVAAYAYGTELSDKDPQGRY